MELGMSKLNRTEKNLWVVLVLLTIFAAVCFINYVRHEIKSQSILRALQYETPEVLSKEYGNASVDAALKDIASKRERISKLKLQDIPEQEAKMQQLDRQIKANKDNSEQLLSKIEIQKGKIRALETSIAERETERNRAMTAPEIEMKRAQEGLTITKTHLESTQREAKRHLEQAEEMYNIIRRYTQTRYYTAEASIKSLRDRLETKDREMRSRDAIFNDTVSGKIIAVDHNEKMAVVNIGKADGVKRGMVFRVFRVEAGVQKTLAMFQAAKINPSTTQGYLVYHENIVKLCSQCGYQAQNREMRFCIYCVQGENDSDVVPLVLRDISNEQNKKILNHVLVSDSITHPLFYPGKTFKFTLIGDRVDLENRISNDEDDELSEEVLKGRIVLAKRAEKERTEKLIDRIKFYGGEYLSDVTQETDIIIAGRLIDSFAAASDDEEKRKAYEKQDQVLKYASLLGIPVLHESNLLMYLNYHQQ